MFKRVLIANRGLIQANGVRAVKELGGTAVTVFESEDRDSAGVRNADEAYELQNSQSRFRPYLDIDQIVRLAEEHGIDAVHPGYGFLAQNARMARELEERGIHFIAPPVDGIHSLSNKAMVKEAAAKAGLPVLRGTGAFSDRGRLESAAGELAFPLMMKPVHGFGGIGVRLIDHQGHLQEAFEALQAASGKFLLNSPEVYLEEYLDGARHIEFPVLRDAEGRTAVFQELDCSLQRRFQKLLVETPAPDIDSALRTRLQSEIRVLCERLGLFGFASVEFLLKDGEPYFLEINGYIQPSHTATTLQTGADLLKEQIRLHSGGGLSHLLEDRPCPERHVIGAFLFAEDPLDLFAPSPGEVDRLYLPFGEEVFMQTSIFSGARISPFYDPMVAKLLVRGRGREEAILKMEIALEEFFVEGVKTNIPLMRGVLKSPEFRDCAVTPEFISRPADRECLIDSLKSEKGHEMAALVAALSLHRDGDTLKRMEALVAEQGESSMLSAATRWLRPRKPRRPL
jgi:acetyl/propionyl-CoA carboxylase alpha subunit